PSVPTPVWGRDELRAGEMWNSNSVISWLLARSGVAVEAVHPPAGGRAPGWHAGLVVARRELASPLPSRRGARRASRAGARRAPLLRHLEPGRAVGRFEDLHPRGLEVHAAEEPDRSLVVDYEHLGHGSRGRPAARGPGAAIPIALTAHSTAVGTRVRATGSSN